MNGKSKCKILKDIRRRIAEENDIAYVTNECKFQGNCSGTCPKCEAEVRYLEEQLRKRRQAGKAVAVAGIAATLVVTASGCLPVQTGGDPLLDPFYTLTDQVDGLIEPPTESTEDLFMGVPETIPSQTETTSPEELMGDVTVPTEDLVDGEIAGE